MTDEEIGRDWGRCHNRRPRFNARTRYFEWLSDGSPTSAVLPADLFRRMARAEAEGQGVLYRELGRAVRE